MYNEKNLLEILTDMLLASGCTVSKPAMQELEKFIKDREQNIVKEAVKRIENIGTHLSNET